MAGISEKRARHLKMLLNLTTFLVNHPGVEVKTICELFDLSPRRLMAALDELLMCGVPPYAPSDYVTGWIEGDRITLINADFLRRPLCLTVGEAVSLKVMINDFLRQSPGVFEDGAETLAAKIGKFLGHGRICRCASGHAGRKAMVIEQALEESRTVQIEYYSRMADRLYVRIIEPLAIIDIDGAWYVAAFCRFRNADRTFRLDRIKSATLLDERFKRPAAVDIKRFIPAEQMCRSQKAPSITVTFGHASARWAKEQFAGSLTTENPDGSIECDLVVTDPIWLADVLAQYEGDAKAAGLPKFRSIFQKRLKSILNIYA